MEFFTFFQRNKWVVVFSSGESHSKLMLQTTTLSVPEIACQVGYSALNNFSDAFQEEFGERPTAVRD